MSFYGNNSMLSSSAYPWIPTYLGANLLLWLDASDSNSIILNGSNVSQWNDKSGNRNHVLQNVAGNQPTYNVSGLNNRPALDFTGDLMITNTNPFGSTINDAFVAVVHKIDSIQQGTLFSLTGSGSSSNRWQAHAPWSNGDMLFDCGGTGIPPNRIRVSYGVSAGSVSIAEFYCSKSENVQQVWKNGSLLVSDNSGHSVSTVLGVSIGGVDTTYQDTTISEVLVYNSTITLQNRQKVEGYLAWKWGLQNNLATGHPYKLNVP